MLMQPQTSTKQSKYNSRSKDESKIIKIRDKYKTINFN